MVRWDSPLLTVPWSDEDVPGEDIWKAITQGNVKPPNAGTQAVCRHTLPKRVMADCTKYRFRKHRQMRCVLWNRRQPALSKQ